VRKLTAFSVAIYRVGAIEMIVFTLQGSNQAEFTHCGTFELVIATSIGVDLSTKNSGLGLSSARHTRQVTGCFQLKRPIITIYLTFIHVRRLSGVPGIGGTQQIHTPSTMYFSWQNQLMFSSRQRWLLDNS
jgi:hypothetical protein